MLISRIEDVRILFPDGARTILNGDRPAEFLDGWRPVLAYSGLAPVTIVTFESQSGGVGCWFLDSEMRRCGGTVGEVTPQMLADMVAALCPLLDGIWRGLMLARRPGAMTEAQRAFFALPEHCRMALVDLYRRTLVSRPSCLSITESINASLGFPVLDCGSRRVPLIAGELHWLFDPGLLQNRFDRLPADGRMILRSPVDGKSVVCTKSLVLETDLIAYRLHDQRWNLTIYLMAGGIFNRTLGLYVPEANIVLCPDPAGFRTATPDPRAMFLAHVARHGAAMFAYLASDESEPVHFWRGRNAIHLGHVLWNDYSGLERVLRAGSGKEPICLVCETGSGPEMYGALERVFPALAGKVWREPAPLLGLVEALYARNAIVFRSSGKVVTRALRERVLGLVPVREAQAQAPVVVLGLRTENRTSTDLEGFCRALVGHLAAGAVPVTLVVDGHNSQDGGGGMIWSHGEISAARSPIDVERGLVETMREAACGTKVAIVSTIGEPLAESLAWGRAAKLFVAFWGAGLAKYRGVCNLPGLVITSRWNLENLGDLEIDSDPKFTEAPTEMVFIAPDAVTDRADAPLLIQHGDTPAPSLINFEVSMPMMLQAFDQVAAGRLHGPDAVPAAKRLAVRQRRKAGAQ